MRYTSEVRIRLHGDREAGQLLVPHARTLLGDLIGRNQAIMENRIGPRISDSMISNQRREPLDVVQQRAGPITVGVYGGIPIIDITVPFKKDEQERILLAYGIAGRAMLNGVAQDKKLGAEDYDEPFLRVPEVLEYWGKYSVISNGVFGAVSQQFVQGTYPHFFDPLQPPPYTYTWVRSTLPSVARRFGIVWMKGQVLPSEVSQVHYPSNTAHWNVSSVRRRPVINPAYSVSRTVKVGAQTFDVALTINKDIGGVAHPIHFLRRVALPEYITQGIVASVPLWHLQNEPNFGRAVVPISRYCLASDTSFFILCATWSMYVPAYLRATRSPYPQISLVRYTNRGAASTTVDIEPMLRGYMTAIADPPSSGSPPAALVPPQCFDGHVNRLLNQIMYNAKMLAIGEGEALISLPLYKREDGQDKLTQAILLATQTTVTIQFADSEPGNIRRIQDWVYLGNNRVLAKFLSGSGYGINFDVVFRYSEDAGVSWIDVGAEGLPSTRKNQFFGNFTLVEPWESEDEPGIVLITAYETSAYYVYESKDGGVSWRRAQKIADTEQFYRVDSLIADDGISFSLNGNSFASLYYYGTSDEPAPFNPAIPELMRYDT